MRSSRLASGPDAVPRGGSVSDPAICPGALLARSDTTSVQVVGQAGASAVASPPSIPMSDILSVVRRVASGSLFAGICRSWMYDVKAARVVSMVAASVQCRRPRVAQ